jgi:predicted transport protein
LENHDRPKELVNVENYTIEHIMPQNLKLSQEWQAELGENWKEVQATYLHTIGNLTLTEYNSEYGDRPFLEKRNMKGGFADSPLHLNRMLAKLDHWSEREIQNRAEALADIAVKVWSFPSVEIDSKNLNSHETPRSSYEDYLHGENLELFEELRKRILNLDASVREDLKKQYIVYKTTTNFAYIEPKKSRLRLSLNIRAEEINDPKRLCKDVTNVSRWGKGDVEVGLSSLDQIDDVIFLVRQAFKKHSDEFED